MKVAALRHPISWRYLTQISAFTASVLWTVSASMKLDLQGDRVKTNGQALGWEGKGKIKVIDMGRVARQMSGRYSVRVSFGEEYNTSVYKSEVGRGKMAEKGSKDTGWRGTL